HDVLVKTAGHAVGELEPARIHRIELLVGDPVLPGHDLLEALYLDQPERGGEFAHVEVEPLDLLAGLAVVTEPPGVLDQLGMLGDQYAALAGRDRLGRVQRVRAGVTVGPGAPLVPGRTV